MTMKPTGKRDMYLNVKMWTNDIREKNSTSKI